MSCHSNITKRCEQGTDKQFICPDCSKRNDRLLIIDPELEWSLDSEKRYIHKSVGVFIYNEKSEVLVIDRVKFPLGMSVPAGHIDIHEKADKAVIREVAEEVGLIIEKPTLVAQTSISGDSCRRGSDDHSWSLYTVSLPTGQVPKADRSEASELRWISLADFRLATVPFAMQHLLDNYGDKIEKVLSKI
jgi:ADP-ribose pyrophosphatase YjhB (NUDIX family)